MHYLKEITVEIVVPLTFLYKSHYNKELCHKHESSAVHKSGSFDESSNFRPISVVSLVAKILEKIVLTQLSSYLADHKSLHPHQGVYRHSKNTELRHLAGCGLFTGNTAVLRWFQNYLTDRTHLVKSDPTWVRMKDGIYPSRKYFWPTAFLDLHEYIAFYCEQWFIIAVCG